jgi:hypothetical protein
VFEVVKANFNLKAELCVRACVRAPDLTSWDVMQYC